MTQPIACEECRVIARELADAYVHAVDTLMDAHGQDAWHRSMELLIDPRFAGAGMASLHARLADDGEPGRQTLPLVAPEILNLSKWHGSFRDAQMTAATPITRAFYRRFMHECRTGHKIRLLSRSLTGLSATLAAGRRNLPTGATRLSHTFAC